MRRFITFRRKESSSKTTKDRASPGANSFVAPDVTRLMSKGKTSLRRTLSVPPCGINRLPNELLMPILLLAVTAYRHGIPFPHPDRLAPLSLTCRRFYDIIQENGEFWAFISDYMSWEEIERNLALSKDKPLYIAATSTDCRYAKELLKKKVSTRRWATLDLSSEDIDSFGQWVPAGDFTSLTTLLSPDYWGRSWEDKWDDIPKGPSCIPFPRVKMLTFECGWADTKIPLPAWFPALSHLEIKLVHDGLRPMLDFLCAAPALQTFKLQAATRSIDTDALRSIGTLRLPRLTSFSLDETEEQGTKNIVQLILALDMPRLQAISLKFAWRAEFEELITAGPGHFNAVTDAELQPFGDSYDGAYSPMHILRAFPALHTLTLHTWSLSVAHYAAHVDLARLRVLRIKTTPCDNLHNGGYIDSTAARQYRYRPKPWPSVRTENDNEDSMEDIFAIINELRRAGSDLTKLIITVTTAYAIPKREKTMIQDMLTGVTVLFNQTEENYDADLNFWRYPLIDCQAFYHSWGLVSNQMLYSES